MAVLPAQYLPAVHAAHIVKRHGLNLGAFQYRNYVLFWIGQLVTNVGSWMQTVATGWLVVQLTNSSATLGINAALMALPIIIFSMVGGVVADRIDRYRMMVLTGILQTIPDVMLAVLVGTGTVQVWHVFVYSLVWGSLKGLNFPARQAFVPGLVPHEEIQSAVALNSILWQGAAVVGPLLAGLALAYWGTASNYYLNVGSDLISLATLFLIRLPPVPPHATKSTAWQDLLASVRYTWDQPIVRTLLVAVAVISFFDRSYTQLMPVFARDVFDVGPQGLGVMMAMPAAGTILIAVALAGSEHHKHRGAEVLLAAAVLGLALVGFAASTTMWVSLLLLVVVGIGATAATSLANTLLLENVSEEMHGRVMAFYMDATQGCSQLGALPIGILAEVIGPADAVNVSAIISLLAIALLAVRARALRQLA
ncbi:MAG TPA: MFS transporter [Chloroflexota bacterium]